MNTDKATKVADAGHGPIAVVVCTAKRGVIFGTTTNINGDTITLSNARMCLRWSEKIGGVFGLAERGPFDASKSGSTTISAAAPSIRLTEITAVMMVTDEAAEAWRKAPVVGR
jgi:hypothetical protein